MARNKKDESVEEGRLIARNPKAFHKFTITQKWEAGMVLQGSEVKSLRMGRATVVEGYVKAARSGELWLHGVEIPQYAQASFANHMTNQPRRLLLHKRQIREIAQHLDQGGRAVLALSIYFKNGVAKVEIGLAMPKTHEDRRDDMRKRESQREVSRELARRRSG